MTTSEQAELSDIERTLYKIEEAELEMQSIEKDLLLYKAVHGENHDPRCYCS